MKTNEKFASFNEARNEMLEIALNKRPNASNDAIGVRVSGTRDYATRDARVIAKKGNVEIIIQDKEKFNSFPKHGFTTTVTKLDIKALKNACMFYKWRIEFNNKDKQIFIKTEQGGDWFIVNKKGDCLYLRNTITNTVKEVWQLVCMFY